MRALALVLLFIPVLVSAQTPGTPTQATPAPITLEDAISRALQKGEEIQVAEAGVRRAIGNDEIAKSQFLPQISAGLTYTRTLQSQYSSLSSGSSSTSGDSSGSTSSLFKNLPFGKENQYTIAVQASQNIYTGGRITGQKDAAEARKRSADIDLTSAQAQLVLNVTQSYYDALLSDRLVAIQSDAVSQAEEVYKNVQLAYKVGEKAEFEALRAKVSRDNQIPLLLQRQNDRAQAYYRLKQLLNLSLDDSLSLASAITDSLARFESVGDTSQEARASVRQAAENVSASDAQIRVAESQRMPQVSVSTRYSPVAYPSDVIPKYSDFNTDWTVSLNVSVPIYTGGAISGSVDVAEAGVDEARARLEQAREAAAMDSRMAFKDLDAARANLQSTSSTVSEAERAYEIARVRYQQGISTQVELDDVRLQEEQARANNARALRNYLIARAKMSLIKDLPVSAALASQPSSAAQSSATQQAGASPFTSSGAQTTGSSGQAGAGTGQPVGTGQSGGTGF
jgi:outer membrane protein